MLDVGGRHTEAGWAETTGVLSATLTELIGGRLGAVAPLVKVYRLSVEQAPLTPDLLSLELATVATALVCAAPPAEEVVTGWRLCGTACLFTVGLLQTTAGALLWAATVVLTEGFSVVTLTVGTTGMLVLALVRLTGTSFCAVLTPTVDVL